MKVAVPSRTKPWRLLTLATVAASALLSGGSPLHAQTVPPASAAAPAVEAFTTTVRNAVLLDVATQSVLFEKAADELQPPASLAKLMTLAVVFEEMRQGRLLPEQEIVISQDAWRRGGAPARGSTMYAAVNSRIRVQDLIRGTAVVSGNDSSIALAEAISGTEANFIPLMQRRARELGLTRSVFRNVTGLPDPEQRMSARETAKLASHIVRTYPDHYAVFSERELLWGNIRQQNRNPLLGQYPGADGMKTGFLDEAGFNLVGSAVQNDGQRLIVVVMGARSLQERSNEARKLLDWGFRSFEMRQPFGENEILGEARVFGGARDTVQVTAGGPVRLLLPRGTSDRVMAQIVYRGPIRAPIRRGMPVGTLQIRRGQQLALEVPVHAADDVAVGTMTQRALQAIVERTGGLVRSTLGRP